VNYPADDDWAKKLFDKGCYRLPQQLAQTRLADQQILIRFYEIRNDGLKSVVLDPSDGLDPRQHLAAMNLRFGE
jgi:hypothetical protein